MGVDIRSMAPDDAAAVASLCVQLGYATATEEVSRRLDVIADTPDDMVLVAVADGEVVGWAQVRGSTLIQVPPFAELGGLVVGEGQRSAGVGEQLLAAAEAWATRRGYQEMRIRSNEIRVRAHSFYLEHGYDLEKTSLTFYKRFP